jgi:hypothetical protein
MYLKIIIKFREVPPCSGELHYSVVGRNSTGIIWYRKQKHKGSKKA